MNNNLNMNIKTGIRNEVPGIFVTTKKGDVIIFFPVSKNKVEPEDYEKVEKVKYKLKEFFIFIKKNLQKTMKEEQISFEDLILNEKKKYAGDSIKQSCFVLPYYSGSSNEYFFTFSSVFSDMEKSGFANGIYFDSEKFELSDKDNMLVHLLELDEKFIELFACEF